MQFLLCCTTAGLYASRRSAKVSMNIASIAQESMDDTEAVMTTVVINGVSSHCILTRLMINALGRPGVDNDMELVGTGDEWVIAWTQPKLTMDETRELVTKAIAPPFRTGQ